MTVSEPSDIRRATEYLIHAEIGELGTLLLYRHIKAGFKLSDVEAMLSEVMPHNGGAILRQILGINPSAKLPSRRQSLRLTPQQSAITFMYAQIFELAFNVFGTWHGAEHWLSQPCRDLDGDVPLDVMDNLYAYRIIEEYLHRIKLGVYQ